MGLLRKILRTQPTPTADGAFSPSALAIKLGTSSTTDYDGGAYPSRYTGSKNRVLMICTEQRNMTMANGKKFSTGNHPVEMGLPMLHLMNAGFEIDIVTPTGAPVAIEMWAMPADDADIQKLYRDYESAFQNPGSLADFVSKSMTDDAPYAAIFIPGGHGAMLGLPDSADLGKVLHWAHNTNFHTLALCHGPAALLAAKSDAGFLYAGYKITVFPDSVDKQTPMIGYLPGPMPWWVCEKLRAQGVEIINKKADNSVHVDRRLVTGASPQAANNFGRLAAETLLKRTEANS
ncbi:molecular chaperone Hsp31 and glyoxalase 3 [Planktotalea frisia]|uniref:Molecular chaperone Hsp31 and glyoxalase 3 n=1 Tax=Planktotalea frisia TaxID=696762 RepID=A0A1L9P2L0_9RHOB|nr:glyoxalase III HchA [Planktotalea frisia]OJI95738.1 molecular chaperone Hsp31 and glyoxalase 3 [Planktotalea frisia]PZX21204.1 molecular chaperone Hsp31 and glyoxalase 3 [Planktotalea frisia]